MAPRKLLLVPILVAGLSVTSLDASGKNGGDGGGWKSYDNSGSLTSYPPGWGQHKPAGNGDGRRIK